MSYNKFNVCDPRLLATNCLEDLLALVSMIDDHRRVARVQVYHGMREGAYKELTEMRKDIDTLRQLLSASWEQIEALKQ